MKKVLLIATFVKKHIMVFHVPLLKMLKEQGWETAVAARNDYENPEDCVIPYCDQYYDLPFERSPFSLSNIKVTKQLRKIMDTEQYDVVHCHTPMGGVAGRIAARKSRKKGTKVFYTAHGFHFYKGAPILNWLIFYPVEWSCAHFTDTLLTINAEDYALAKKHMHAKEVVYVPGVGVDFSKFAISEEPSIRKELGISSDATVLLSVGELNKNKNQQVAIRAIEGLDVYYIIAGVGPEADALQLLSVQQNMENHMRFLGYRKDVQKLYAEADVFVFPSYREGLSLSLMEAMASGLPCAVSRIRGNTDLIDEQGGSLFDPGSVDECRNAIMDALSAKKEKGNYNKKKVEKYKLENVLLKMRKIYGISETE